MQTHGREAATTKFQHSHEEALPGDDASTRGSRCHCHLSLTSAISSTFVSARILERAENEKGQQGKL